MPCSNIAGNQVALSPPRFSEIAWSVGSRVALPLTVSTWVLGVNRAGDTGDTAPVPLVPAGRRANSPEATRMQ